MIAAGGTGCAGISGIPYLLRRNLRGSTTKRVNSPAKVAAAAMAGIISWATPRIRDNPIMAAACYRGFTRMLNVCYTQRSAIGRLVGDGRGKGGGFRPIAPGGPGGGAAADRPRGAGLLVAQQLAGQHHPQHEKSDKGPGSGDG